MDRNMAHFLIALTDEEIGDQAAATVFDEKLRHALSCKEPSVVIRLRPELGCGTEVLEWLEEWTDKFQKAKKNFFIVPANVNQLECLEVSHPDQELRYAATLEELEDRIAAIDHQSTLTGLAASEEETAFLVEDVPPAQKGPAKAAHAEDKLDFEVIDKEEGVLVRDMRIQSGSIVQISGEYICEGCRTSRMWLKGDIAKDCENAECVHPGAGWKMTYELF
jgi:hypothetical protein